MKRHTFVRSLATIFGFVFVVSAGPARGSDSCIREAKHNDKSCNADNKETFQAAKDACLNRDHACVEACRADRYDCRQATGYDAAVAQCDDTLAAAKAQCRADFPKGSPERDGCIDQAQVVAFQCRDIAREMSKQALNQCRKVFRTCAAACPAPAPATPVDVKQCKRDAKAAYKTEKMACKEDFQVAKDACRHKDHACVEQCRSNREACRQPVDDQLDSDVATCNTQRDSDKAVCHSLYGDGTPELDQCIDNAQVQAFECRDAAREAARPGYQTCRQDFQMCVMQCPDV